MNLTSYQRLSTLYGEQEVIHAMLWDTLVYTSGATLQLTFFQVVPATVDLGNMEVGGQLASPKSFLIRAIRLFLKQRPESVNQVAPAAIQTGAINNIALLFYNAELRINIGSKEYGRYPAHLFSAGGGASGQMGVQNILIGGAFADYGQLGVPSAKNVFALATPLLIEPQMNFNVVLTWGAAQTLTRSLPICCALEGDLIRPVQ